MKSPKTRAFAILAVATLAWAAPTQAQVITYYPEATEWRAAVGNYAQETFDDAVLHSDIASIVGNVEIGVESTSFFAASPPVLRGVVDGDEAVTFNFARPMVAFGANWDLFHPGGPESQITLTLLDGATHTIQNWLANTDRGQFSGIISEIPFMSFQLSAGTFGDTETFEMDNLKFAAAIPEPQTYAMLLAGLGLMGFIARRRRGTLAV